MKLVFQTSVYQVPVSLSIVLAGQMILWSSSSQDLQHDSDDLQDGRVRRYFPNHSRLPPTARNLSCRVFSHGESLEGALLSLLLVSFSSPWGWTLRLRENWYKFVSVSLQRSNHLSSVLLWGSFLIFIFITFWFSPFFSLCFLLATLYNPQLMWWHL